MKNLTQYNYKVNQQDREKQNKHKGKCIWFIGLSGAGKSTLANLLEIQLHQEGYKTYVLDSDNIRSGLNKDLGFSDNDRMENIRRVSEVAKFFVDAGIIVLLAFITPFEKDRQQIKKLMGKDNYLQIFVDCPLEVCQKRDVKNLYTKAIRNEIQNFTGISSSFETPQNNDLIIKTNEETEQEGLEKLLNLVLAKIQL